MPEPEFLSYEEVWRLTGYKQPKRQAEWCEWNDVDYKINAQNRVIINREWLRGKVTKPAQWANIPREPDFSRV